MTPVTKLDISSWKIPNDIKLADEQFHHPRDIDLLIGADLFYEMSLPGRCTRPGNFPVLQETFLGWTIAGRTPANTTVKEVKRAFLQRETMTAEQKSCEDHFLTHTTRQPDGKFVVKLPTKMGPTQLGASRLSAERRLHTIESRLERDPDLKVQYHNFMKKHEETSQKSVKFQERTEIYYFRPHHPVSKETTSTTGTKFVSGGSDKPSISNQRGKRKWASNHPKSLDTIPRQLQVKMDSVTAVKGPTEPVYTFAPQTTTI